MNGIADKYVSYATNLRILITSIGSPQLLDPCRVVCIASAFLANNF